MENTKSENKILLIAFYMFGIGALVAWNAILSIMDFFQKFQKEYSPEYVYPNMNFVLNLVFQFLLVFIGNKFSYKLQLLTCMIMSGIALVLLPIVTYSFNGLVGFIATSFIILFQGFANAVVLSGLYGLASFLPGKYILAMSTGQGISGVLMNVVRYIVILSFGDSDDDLTITKSAIVFFAIAALIVITNIYFLFQIYKDSYFIQQLAKSGEFSQEVLASHNILIEEEDKININPNPQTNSDSFKTEGQSDFKRTMSFILDLCFLLALNYLITFIVFPGVSIKGKLFSLSPSLNINTLILIFNVGDTIGRKLPSYLKLDKNQVGYIVFFRFIFLLTFSFIAIANDSDNLGSFANSTFVIINMIIFSLTNGFITSSLFSIAPGLVPNELKGMSGSILSFFLIIGIFSGTLYALFIIKNII